ncbi:histidine kinase dimerization/phospho-acceptor domain-containing protein [Paracoccus shanxieyensis]|uniref:histidine kinase n=1 Tax=Paracoccus shanxieyensis TaxID=2675752 RepID=A0A6L6J374_9RHOB|nr:histidine kinase dimerization/phospho-acceptor domain-containing protein [Paracoccus shanxieyensis]MTH65187.1 two-component sensor histidine kinase [Paracoccus shanxieyensis]MTH88331.1 two-component sensor histidine kinase [Paracoccus shanxieyensis]
MRRSSLLRDLVAGFGAGIVLVWLAALLIGWIALREELDEIYDATLSRVADHVLTSTGQPGPADARGALWVELTGPEGEVRFRSGGPDGALLPPTLQSGFSESGAFRVLTLQNPDGSVLRVADPLSERREAARETLVSMLLPSVLLLPLAFVLMRGFVRRRLAPIRALSLDVGGRGASDLHPLAARDMPDELAPLRAAIDILMARLAEAFEAERSFSANAAHELRTPIAAAYAQTQLLIDEAESPGVRSRAQTIARAMQRLTRLSARLLDLARAEALQPDDPGPQDLAAVLRLVATDCQPGHVYDIPDRPVLVRMDVDVFAPMARNLIENAELHGRAPIRVRLTEQVFEVGNRGPVVPPDRLAHLTRRFERAGSREVGSGLGLAIVETLAKHAGARLELLSPQPGHADGFLARVHFAQAPRQDA